MGEEERRLLETEGIVNLLLENIDEHVKVAPTREKAEVLFNLGKISGWLDLFKKEYYASPQYNSI